jgi:DNA invertase Pin-like site-specific DNA recombinase
MSTEHQRYSLANQAEAISEYASARGYQLTRSYFDPSKSGLMIGRRDGLQMLLLDVLQRDRDFDAVLVLDVSRWGRFQDHDEAAHYEFICRSAGVSVIYCAEPFENDQTPVSNLMKRLKRLMAAEFSRDLSEKIHRAQLRLARLGFHAAGTAIYGFRRVAVSPDGGGTQVLEAGVPKPLITHRVIIRPGPPEELAVIRRIFRRFTLGYKSPRTIAWELEAEGVDPGIGRRWTEDRVRRLLQNELVVGISVSRRTRQHLRSKRRKTESDEWIRVKVCDPIVSRRLFNQAQGRFKDQRRFTEKSMLLVLEAIWRRHGKINADIINATPGAPCAGSYAHYFGKLSKAYDAIGYPWRVRRPKRSSDELLDGLRDAFRRHGYLSTSVLAQDPATSVVSTYRRRFGSLSRAYQLAGLPHDHSDLIRRAHEHIGRTSRPRSRPRRGVGLPNPATNDELLEHLRQIQAHHGAVSNSILRSGDNYPRQGLLRRRFGSLREAYRLAGLPSDQLTLVRMGVERRSARFRAAREEPRPPLRP